jgi:glyoxylase-like metal-dependent hydrolase (beta-lactamase superfamily II)
MKPWILRHQEGTTCLLVETGQGLVLIDCGIASSSYIHPTRKMRFIFKTFGVLPNLENSVIKQIEHLGYSSGDIKHIVLSHAHFDHAGGVADFPEAWIHLHEREYSSFLHPKRWLEIGYHRADLAPDRHITLYSQITDQWLGWDAIRLPFAPEIFLIPLFGHTKGLCGVAIKHEKEWIFYCADAIPLNADFHITPAWLNRLVLGPHGAAIERWSREHPEVHLIAGHMWQSLY